MITIGKLGKYTLRHDPHRHPPTGTYIVSLRGKPIGSQLSYPSFADCQRMDAKQKEEK